MKTYEFYRETSTGRWFYVESEDKVPCACGGDFATEAAARAHVLTFADDSDLIAV